MSDTTDPTAGERCRYVMHGPGDTCDCKARLAQVVTHTRTSANGNGPDYCAECSAAISEWVQWPCSSLAQPGVVPGTGVHRHGDGSECLWGTTDQKWYRMHPLYPLRECEQDHPATPAAGDVEHIVTLHDKITGLVWSCTCGAIGAGDRQRMTDAARRHASDWLAAVRREAEQKALTEAADTWERLCTRGHPLDAEVADRIVPWLRDRAARIGGESR